MPVEKEDKSVPAFFFKVVTGILSTVAAGLMISFFSTQREADKERSNIIKKQDLQDQDNKYLRRDLDRNEQNDFERDQEIDKLREDFRNHKH